MPILHDNNNHNYHHPPCPEGMEISEEDLSYCLNLTLLKGKDLTEECKKVGTIKSGTKHEKILRLIAKRLNRKDWVDFGWGYQQIILCNILGY